jgi:ribosomal protein S12 methylthiotransferase accessory factor
VSGPGLASGPLAAIGEAIGVTRVARVTGLDRTGVEVACAVRPGGHVLQVSNGKGRSLEQATAGAILEACELWGAERPPPGLVTASLRELAAAGRACLEPGALGEADRALEGARIAWQEARLLGAGAPSVLAPACALYCPPASAPTLGPAPLRWTSNGMGAHPSREAALLHALLEAVERDRLARAFPGGLAPGALRARLLSHASLRRAAPKAAALAAELEARRFAVHLLDAAPEGDRIGLPVAAALLVDRDAGPVPVAGGYACRLGRDDALVAALLEAAQSRATEIHGAREDVAEHGRDASLPIARACARARPRREARALPTHRARGAAAAVALVLSRLRRGGFATVAAADLPSPPGVAVVKVLVPGLLLSELL